MQFRIVELDQMGKNAASFKLHATRKYSLKPKVRPDGQIQFALWGPAPTTNYA